MSEYSAANYKHRIEPGSVAKHKQLDCINLKAKPFELVSGNIFVSFGSIIVEMILKWSTTDL